MPGPSTEVLNDDIRLLRDEVHRADLDVREVGTQVKTIAAAFKVLGVFTLASLLSGIWWGASLTTKVDWMGSRFDKLESRFDKVEVKVVGLESRFDKFEAKVDGRFDRFEERLVGLESRFDKFEAKVDARFDKLEALILKLVEQSKPAARP